jgi:hypothetical protein
MKFISDIKWLSLITKIYLEGLDAHSCHIPYGSGPHLPIEVSSDAVTCPMGPYGSRGSSIKESLAGLPVQLGTHVSNARAHVSKAPHVGAIMRLQDVQADSIVNTCKVYRHASTVCLQYGYSVMPTLWTTRQQCQVTRQYDTTLLTE